MIKMPPPGANWTTHFADEEKRIQEEAMAYPDPSKLTYVDAYDMGYREAQQELVRHFKGFLEEMRDYRPSEPEGDDRVEERAYWAARLAMECAAAAEKKPT